MSGRTELTPVAELVLARLLVAGEKGATPGDFKKALEPLLGHRWTGAALPARIEETIDALATAGLVARVRKGRSVRDALTTEGRRRILEVLGLDELPPKSTWDRLKKTCLAARALGLDTPRGEEAKRFGTDNGFKGALLKARFDLPLGAYPGFPEALDALAWSLLGLSPGRKFNVANVQAALFRCALGETREPDPRPDPKKEATKLLSRTVGARKSGKDELRLAALRSWIDAEPAPPPAEPGADLAAFARRVVEAARSSPSGRFGTDKVFVVHVWRALEHDPSFATIGLDGFKRRLAEANNARLLDLSRADMVEAMDPDDVRLSEVPYLGATFHFVRV